MTATAMGGFLARVSSQEGIEFVFTSAISDAIADGVQILEMSIETLVLRLYPPSPPQGMIDYLRDLKALHANEIAFAPELGISRDHALSDIEPIVTECIDSGVFSSIDLYGNELAQPPEAYQSLYAAAKRAGLKLKAHTGEFGSAESIRHTVEVLDLDEVQHGINAASSPEIMNWLGTNSIRLNICPTSNVALQRTPTMKEHPIRVLYDHGISVTINTDDLTIFDQSVSEEYLNLFQAGVFSADELDQIRQASLRTR